MDRPRKSKDARRNRMIEHVSPVEHLNMFEEKQVPQKKYDNLRIKAEAWFNNAHLAKDKYEEVEEKYKRLSERYDVIEAELDKLEKRNLQLEDFIKELKEKYQELKFEYRRLRQ